MGTSARGEVEKWLFHLLVRWRRRREELSHPLPLISYYHTLITTYHIYTLNELWIIKVLANCSLPLPLPLPLPGKIGNSLFIILTPAKPKGVIYEWICERERLKMGSEFETESELTGFEEGVLETLKRCEQRNETTLVSAMEVAKCLRSWQVQLPSPELGQLLVSRLCSSSSSSSSSSSLWKFIEQALSSRLLYPLQLLSLLTSRYLIDFHIF